MKQSYNTRSSPSRTGPLGNLHTRSPPIHSRPGRLPCPCPGQRNVGPLTSHLLLPGHSCGPTSSAGQIRRKYSLTYKNFPVSWPLPAHLLPPGHRCGPTNTLYRTGIFLFYSVLAAWARPVHSCSRHSSGCYPVGPHHTYTYICALVFQHLRHTTKSLFKANPHPIFRK